LQKEEEKREKMKNGKIVIGTGTIVLLVLAASLVVTPSSVALPHYPANSTYFLPEDSSGAYCENITYVEIRVNTSVANLGGGMDIYYDPLCVNITAANFSGTPWSQMRGFTDWGNYARISNFDLMGAGASGDNLFATITLHCINSSCDCHTSLNFSGINGWVEPSGFNIDQDLTNNSHNGTFTCGAVETFNKDLYKGWNLVSLPLTPEDSSTNAVLASLTGNYEAVYKYDTSSHGFVQANTMVPGTGYFINMTANDTWTYEGSAYTTMAASLEQGLNMVGWLNCTQDSISAALSSIEGSYRYLARWNTSLQNYEVYVPGAPEIFHEFSVLTRGEGYFIAAKQSDTLEASCPG